MSGLSPFRTFHTTGPPITYGNSTADFLTGNGSMGENGSSLFAVTTGMTSCAFDYSQGVTVCTTIQEVVTNATTITPEYPLWLTIILGTLAGCISVLTILGNILVLLSFGLERSIRQPTNYFLASLAVSDLLIGTFSMPLCTQYLLLSFWPLGPWLCDLWLSLDWTVCLTSQYTVFLITMDRFLSVKIPAKYRNWRTERKVLVMIAITWILPTLVFFTTIIGWQYFVGERSVDEHTCEVQFMSDPLFTFLLTLGYFWITLVVMCTLYAGIYMVALKLQRKSDAKQKILKSAMELAADHAALRNTLPNNSNDSPIPKPKAKSKKPPVENNKPPKGIVKTTSFSKQKSKENDDDRSSSPAFASDDENSSSQGAGGTSKTPLTTNSKPKRIKDQEGFINNALQPDSCKFPHRSPVEFLLPAQIPGINLLQAPEVRVDFPSDIANDPSTVHVEFDNLYSSSADKSTAPLLQNNDIMKGSRYIDEKSFQSVQPENVNFLVDTGDATAAPEEQGSPVWQRRASVEGVVAVTVDPPTGTAPLQDKREFMLEDEVNVDGEKIRSDNNGTNPLQTLNPDEALEERGLQRLALAARKRRKNGRLQNLVKSVRSRNSRRRNRRERKSKSENRARKALRTITFILGAFVLCWTPYHIMVLVIAICKGYYCINLKFYNFTYWLCYLNSPINPFCYAFANAQFKRTFIRILKLDWHRT